LDYQKIDVSQNDDAFVNRTTTVFNDIQAMAHSAEKYQPAAVKMNVLYSLQSEP
jgi:hypothetical protein